MILKGSNSIINGLVLAGGTSQRMGKDKTNIVWHDKPQSQYIAELIAPFCSDVYISRREVQQADIDFPFKVLLDSVTGLGPFGAILSAFKMNDSCAWLVVASDLPLLDHRTVNYLVEQRDQNCMATTYKSPVDGLPEPLISIWEPSSYPALLSFQSQGFTCPRKVLLNVKVRILEASNPESLINVNTPTDAAIAERLIQNKIKDAGITQI